MDDLTVRLAWALSVTGGLAVLAVWLARRGILAVGRRAPASPALACVETLRLTPQHTLHLVALGSQRYLVACHASGAQVLAAGPPEAIHLPGEGVRSHAATAS